MLNGPLEFKVNYLVGRIQELIKQGKYIKGTVHMGIGKIYRKLMLKESSLQ